MRSLGSCDHAVWDLTLKDQDLPFIEVESHLRRQAIVLVSQVFRKSLHREQESSLKEKGIRGMPAVSKAIWSYRSVLLQITLATRVYVRLRAQLDHTVF